MPRPNKLPSIVRRFIATLIAVTATITVVAAPASAPAQAQTVDAGQSVTIPSLPYPKSGLRKRLIAAGNAIPDVDESLQAGIPAIFYEPDVEDGKTAAPYRAVVALPDCDNQFPHPWITILQKSGYAVLLISPPNAHPDQDYCGGGQLQTPKHGLSYWAFDAISALHYLSKQQSIDAANIAVFGYGYGAGAAQLAIYRDGHAKHYQRRFKALVGLRPQCMSEMDNFAPSLLVAVKNDPFNPPAWCLWRIDRDLRPDRENVTFKIIDSDQKVENQTTREQLTIETTAPTVSVITDFLSGALSE